MNDSLRVPLIIPDTLDLELRGQYPRREIVVWVGMRKFGPEPARWALQRLAPEILARVDIWPDEEAITAALAVLHFRSVKIGRNRAGEDYPSLYKE